MGNDIDLLQAHIAQLLSNLEAMRKLKEAAEEDARRAREGLWKIAGVFFPQQLDALVRSNPLALKNWKAEEVADWLLQVGRVHLLALERASSSTTVERLREAEEENRRLEEENRKLRQELERTREELQRLRRLQDILRAREEEVARLRARLRDMEQQAASRPGAVNGIPERALALVLAIGDTGACLRASIAREMFRRGVISSPSPELLWRDWERAIKDGLLEEIEVPAETRGRAPRIVRLTEKGREVYRQASGKEPVDSLYDRLLRRHKSPEHTLLNLLAADVLEEHGATRIELFPPPWKVDNVMIDVDIVAEMDGRTIYVEVERGKWEKPDKWSNYVKYIGQDVYVVVPNTAAQSRVLGELSKLALQEGVEVRAHICCLSNLKPEGPFWTLERTIAFRKRIFST